jgi:hypothetical protein
MHEFERPDDYRMPPAREFRPPGERENYHERCVESPYFTLV